jgi:hypothetical protein
MGVRINRTEMTLDTTDFLLEDLVPEACLELALAEARRRDVHRILATAEQHVRHARRERGAVQWCLRRVRLEHPQSLRFVHARALVLGAGDEVARIRRQLEVRDNIAVSALIALDLLARLRVEERNLARLVARQDRRAPRRERRKGAHGRLGSDRTELVRGRLTLYGDIPSVQNIGRQGRTHAWSRPHG